MLVRVCLLIVNIAEVWCCYESDIIRSHCGEVTKKVFGLQWISIVLPKQGISYLNLKNIVGHLGMNLFPVIACTFWGLLLFEFRVQVLKVRVYFFENFTSKLQTSTWNSEKATSKLEKVTAKSSKLQLKTRKSQFGTWKSQLENPKLQLETRKFQLETRNLKKN